MPARNSTIRFFNPACSRSTSSCSLRLTAVDFCRASHSSFSLAASSAPVSVYVSGVSETCWQNTAKLVKDNCSSSCLVAMGAISQSRGTCRAVQSVDWTGEDQTFLTLVFGQRETYVPTSNTGLRSLLFPQSVFGNAPRSYRAAPSLP